jgi:hypothetical protein
MRGTLEPIYGCAYVGSGTAATTMPATITVLKWFKVSASILLIPIEFRHGIVGL